MEGHEAGDKFSVDVAAADAYGEKRDGLGQRVPKKHFGGQRLEPGMQVVLQTNFGPRAVTIEKVGMSVVDVDLNHPMAGKDLHFDVEIVEVREATRRGTRARPRAWRGRPPPLSTFRIAARKTARLRGPFLRGVTGSVDADRAPGRGDGVVLREPAP